MQKRDLILKQLARTNKKNFENYVVSGIWHKLDSLDYKIVTQQYIFRKDRGYAETDLYFPQLNLHVEVDEAYHKANAEADKLREMDIVNATSHRMIRVDCSESIESINRQIDQVVSDIRAMRTALGDDFIPWNPEKEIATQTYIDKGEIRLEENVAFRRIVDAVNCFGYHHKGFQKAGIKHSFRENTLIWFPKIHINKGWDNQLTEDEDTIYEKPLNPDEVKAHREKIFKSGIHTRIVFAQVKDSLNMIMYRFKGEYQLNMDMSKAKGCLVWERTKTTVKTYKPKMREA
jgi:very-short-patch-repair endonuclease